MCLREDLNDVQWLTFKSAGTFASLLHSAGDRGAAVSVETAHCKQVGETHDAQDCFLLQFLTNVSEFSQTTHT